jgi:lysozyme family protein
MKLTQELRDEYVDLFNSMKVDSDIVKLVTRSIKMHKNRYTTIEDLTKVPWYIIATIHALEASLDFKNNLHNGQRWDQITTMVPKGVGPFNSWEEAAVDAMENLKEKLGFEAWYIPEICFAFEDHNGWGYRKYHSSVKSPYLWAGSNHYTSGKYVADGKWDANAISKQIGAMCIIKLLVPELESSKIEHLVESSNNQPSMLKKITSCNLIKRMLHGKCIV